MSLRRILCCSLLPLAVLACEPEGDATSTERGIAWSLAEHRAATISDLAYGFDLWIPEDRAEPIRASTTIRFAWADPDLQPVVVDFMEPAARVQQVRVGGAAVEWEAVEDHIVIGAAAFSDGANEIEIVHTAGDEALNRNDEFLYALFVPDRAHFSLPVFDQPNLKGTVQWSVSVPEGWVTVANGPEAEEMVEEGGRTTTRFSPTEPIPTYLFAFAAGRFQVETETVDGRPMRMYHRETDDAKVARNRNAIFELHGRALAWMEEYTGIGYPFAKFDFVLVPSFQYGGMEHPGGILYRQGGLMLDETATQGQYLGRASVIAHETAHMWFGDLVTMNWFDDVWTKEVFANFMAAKIVEPSFPEVDHDLRFVIAHHPSAYGVDRTPGANPIRQPLENLREAGTLYGAIIYQKAPIVMRQLEARVGEDSFRDGLREYLQTFSYGNATWPDLIEILDRRSLDDLAAWSRVWVEEAGRPTIRVELRGQDIVVRQEDPTGSGRVWPQRLRLAVGRNGGVDFVDADLAGGDPVVLEGAAQGADFVLPNGSGVEYGSFALDDASRAWLLEHAADIDRPVVRGAAWVTLWDQVEDGLIAPTDFLNAVVSALDAETNELILGRLIGYLGATWWSYLPASERAGRAAQVEETLWRGATGPLAATARSSFLSAYRSNALTEAGVARLRRLWDGSERVPDLPLSESDQTAFASALALRGVDDAETIVAEQQDRIENPDRAARFRFVRPSLSADPVVRAEWFAQLSDPKNREREPWALAGLGNLHHPLRQSESLPLVRPALDMLEEVQRTGDIFFPGRWLDATLGGHTSVEAAEVVVSFLDENPNLPPRLRAKLLQSADGVERAARIVHRWDGSIR